MKQSQLRIRIQELGGTHLLLDVLLRRRSEVVEVHVARIALVPHRCDPHLRLVHPTRDLPHVGGVELRLTRALRLALRNDRTVLVRSCQAVAHGAD